MSSGGRPTLPPEDRRQERAIYLSPREFNKVELLAKEAGLKVPEFMRQAVTSKILKASPVISLDQWSKLAPLSSNINQIAARLNSNSGDPLLPGDRKFLAELDDLLREIRLRLLDVEPSE